MIKRLKFLFPYYIDKVLVKTAPLWRVVREEPETASLHEWGKAERNLLVL